MFSGIVGGLFVAWFLSLFGVNNIIILGLHELIGITISNAGYYTIFAIIGAFSGVIKKD